MTVLLPPMTCSVSMVNSPSRNQTSRMLARIGGIVSRPQAVEKKHVKGSELSRGTKVRVCLG